MPSQQQVGEVAHRYEFKTGMVIPFPVKARARVEVQRVRCDFGILLNNIERTVLWLERNHVVVLGFGCSTLRGAVVCAEGTHRLGVMLSDARVSRGHRESGAGRVEQWEARDQATGVLITWEERPCCA